MNHRRSCGSLQHVDAAFARIDLRHERAPRVTDSLTISDSGLSLRPSMLAGMQREWTRLAQPGTWWTGVERVAIATVARDAVHGSNTSSPALHSVVTDMVARVATSPHAIERAAVDSLAEHGVRLEAFVELVGITARLIAVDTTIRGIGAAPAPLPSPIEGQPSRHVEPRAKRRSAHVPMIGAAGATTALSSVAAEDAAQADLHGALYLHYAEMGDLTIVKEIPRWQMELAATTTSWINHCVY